MVNGKQQVDGVFTHHLDKPNPIFLQHLFGMPLRIVLNLIYSVFRFSSHKEHTIGVKCLFAQTGVTEILIMKQGLQCLQAQNAQLCSLNLCFKITRLTLIFFYQ